MSPASTSLKLPAGSVKPNAASCVAAWSLMGWASTGGSLTAVSAMLRSTLLLLARRRGFTRYVVGAEQQLDARKIVER